MKVSNKILKAWRQEVENYGPTRFSKEAGIHHVTLKKALKTSSCRVDVFNKINMAVIALRDSRANDPIIKKIIVEVDE